MSVKAYLTLDYELYMGRKVGSVDNCLIKPMFALTSMLEKYGIKCNVFVDAAYLLRCYQLKEDEPKIMNDFLKVTSHIYELSKAGHSIQFHFHPQWLYSRYVGEDWDLDFDHYKISDMPTEDIIKYVPQAIELLQQWSVNKITAFRAGGYSFPNEGVFMDILRKYGITIDSSVLKGAVVKSKYQTYDYSKVPHKSPYRFDKNLCSSNDNGDFTEYPISTIKMIGYRYWFLKRSMTRHYNTLQGGEKFGDGLGIGIPGGRLSRINHKIKRLITSSVISATIDGILSLCLDKVYKANTQCDEANVFVIIGHPKNLSEKSIDVFERFICNHDELNFCLF